MPDPSVPRDPPRTTRKPWRQIVVEADPEQPKNSRIVPEYEFPGRTFTGDYTKRGPYAPDDD